MAIPFPADLSVLQQFRGRYMSISAVTWALVALGAFALSGSTEAEPALGAGATVTVSVSGVRSEEGHLLSTLCADRSTFMRGCMTFAHSDPAHAGSVTVVFRNVKPGTYAFFALHDLDNNRVVKIPPDGWAFGNDANFPPTFDAASFAVGSEDVRIHAPMRYLGASSGVTPPGTTQSPASLAASASPFSDLKSVPVNDGDLVAEFYAPSDTQRYPAIIVVSGSDGSLSVARNLGANFARHGYAVLVLAYWGQAPLPSSLEGIRLEYFKGAIDWLGRQASVDPHHIGMIGWLRGAEAALLVAAHYPEIRAVVGVSPTSMVWPGLPRKAAWTLGGKPLSNIPLNGPGGGTFWFDARTIHAGPATHQQLSRSGDSRRAYQRSDSIALWKRGPDLAGRQDGGANCGSLEAEPISFPIHSY
jgi:uncharacterized protein (DUF2141 family)/poly(3-hydroxybutyrate) depolymerase